MSATILNQLQVTNTDEAFEKYLGNAKPTLTQQYLTEELAKEVGIREKLPKTMGLCPVLKVQIAAPCQVGQCRFHVTDPHSANCLLVYTARQGNDRINLVEQSWLFKRPLKKLQETYQSAVLKVQAKIFREWAEGEGLPLFYFFPTAKVCCVCESRIDEVPCAKMGELAYCSPECVKETPTSQIRLEKLFGLRYDLLEKHLPKCFDGAVSTAILATHRGK